MVYTKIITIVLGGLGLLLPFTSFAYSNTATHPVLTEEIVTLYNTWYPEDALSNQEKEWVIEGSVSEDIVPRPLNHLYDPIHHHGWTGVDAGWSGGLLTRIFSVLALLPDKARSAIEWLQDDITQEAYGRYGGNRSWQSGMRYSANGETQKASQVLGSALHLLEDLGVPDHTRDDTHYHAVGWLTGDPGSPYESYTKRYSRENAPGFTSTLSSRKNDVPLLSQPSGYLETIARYSNASFFSRDTIKDERFALPKIVREENSIAYGVDTDGNEVALAHRVGTYRLFTGRSSKLILEDGKEFNSLLEKQFRLIGERTVLLGVGLVRHFRLEAKRSQQTSSPQVNGIGSLAGEIAGGWRSGFSLAQASDALAGTAARASDAWKWLVGNRGERPVENPKTEEIEKKSDISLEVKDSDEIKVIDAVSVKKTPTKKKIEKSSAKKPLSKQSCSSTKQGNSLNDVWINEVAWMGTTHSASDEWIELYNLGDTAVLLDGWTLFDSEEKITISLDGIRIPSKGFALLERTDDTSVPYVSASATYVGALSNAPQHGFYLTLRDENCLVVDSITVTDSWPGGDAESRRTMERSTFSTWQSSSQIGGTPKQENSSGWQQQEEEEREGAEVSTTDSTTTVTTMPTVVTPSSGGGGTTLQVVVIDSAPLEISEVQEKNITAGDEFIKLYNPTDRTVQLRGWSIQYASGDLLTTTSTVYKKDFEEGMSIAAKDYFLIARRLNSEGEDGYTGSAIPDMEHRSFSLSGNGGIVLLVRGQDRVMSVTDASVIDYLVYMKAEIPTENEETATSTSSSTVDISPEDISLGSSMLLRFSSSTDDIRLQLSDEYPSWDAQNTSTIPSWILISLLPEVTTTTTFTKEITTADLSDAGAENALVLGYETCGGYKTEQPFLVIPLNPIACQSGGVLSNALDYGHQEDVALALKLIDTDLSDQQIITLVGYRFSGGRAGLQYFTLDTSLIEQIAVKVSNGDAPSAPEVFTASSTVDSREVLLDWSYAQDTDDRDLDLLYEYSIISGTVFSEDEISWESNGVGRAVTLQLDPGIYVIGLRVVDPQGNYSEVITREVEVVESSLPEHLEHQDRLSHQQTAASVQIAKKVNLSSIEWWLEAEGGSYCCSYVYVNIHDSDGALIARSKTGGLRVSDGSVLKRLDFQEPITLDPGSYTFYLEKDSATNSNGFYVYGSLGLEDEMLSWLEGGIPYFRLRE